MSHKVCPRCQTPAPLQAPTCLRCGRQYRTTAPQPPPDEPTRIYPGLQDPTQYAGVGPGLQRTDLCAVLACVFGGFGWFFLACLFGPAAFALGVVSLHRLRENPSLKGKPMAVVGTILGALSLLYTIYQFARLQEALSGNPEPPAQQQAAPSEPTPLFVPQPSAQLPEPPPPLPEPPLPTIGQPPAISPDHPQRQGLRRPAPAAPPVAPEPPLPAPLVAVGYQGGQVDNLRIEAPASHASRDEGVAVVVQNEGSVIWAGALAQIVFFGTNNKQLALKTATLRGIEPGARRVQRVPVPAGATAYTVKAAIAYRNTPPATAGETYPPLRADDAGVFQRGEFRVQTTHFKPGPDGAIHATLHYGGPKATFRTLIVRFALVDAAGAVLGTADCSRPYARLDGRSDFRVDCPDPRIAGYRFQGLQAVPVTSDPL
jgi:hypothetical protein